MMVDYKPRYYTGKNIDYTPRNPASKQDTRPKFYEPKRPIKDIPPTKTYDTKPRRYVATKTYDKVRKYESYAEYVPPWSRDKVKGEKGEKRGKGEKGEQSAPHGDKPTDTQTQKKDKVTFAPAPIVVEEEDSLQAVGSIKRMLMLFDKLS